MTSKRPYFFVIFAWICGVVMGVFAYTKYFTVEDDDHIDALNSAIDSLSLSNEKRFLEIKEFEQKYDSVFNIVLKSEDVIDSLKTRAIEKQKYYENKIKSVSSFKHGELEGFFADRYDQGMHIR